MKKMILKRTIVILLTLCMLSAFVLPVGANSINDSIIPETIYYFTDTDDISIYRPYLQSLANVQVCHFSNQTDFWNYITVGVELNNLDCMQADNAYVIFELTKGFPLTPIANPNDRLHTDVLEDMFQAIKGNGGHIMFICDLEEKLFYPHTVFLDYVDIHVNTDLRSLFDANAIVFTQYYTSAPRLQNCTFILDKNSSNNLQDGTFYGRFLYYKLIPWIKTQYRYEIEQLGQTLETVLISNNINILCQTNGFYFKDFATGNTVIYSDEILGAIVDFMTYLEDKSVCTYGSSVPISTDAVNWLSTMTEIKDIFESSTLNFQSYFYDPYETIFSSIDTSDVRFRGRSLLDYRQTITTIMYKFLSGDDLTEYDNYPEGRANISQRAGNQGISDWMLSWEALAELLNSLNDGTYDPIAPLDVCTVFMSSYDFNYLYSHLTP